MQVGLINLRSVRIIVLYRPPISAGNCLNVDLFLDEFSTLLEEVVPCSAELLILGDFNFHVYVADDNNVFTFTSLLNTFDLQQLVNVSTHVLGYTLGLVITRSSIDGEFLNNLRIFEQPISDHKVIAFHLKQQKPLKTRKTTVLFHIN